LPIEAFKFFVAFDGEPYLAIVLSVYANLSISETFQKDEVAENLGSSAAEFSSLMVRHWDSWGTYSKRNHIFLAKLHVNSSGLFSCNQTNVIDIMKGYEMDCPGKGVGQGAEEFSISPDGTYLSFAARKTYDDKTQKKDFAWTTDVAVYLVDLVSLLNPHSSHVIEIVSDKSSHAVNTHPIFSTDNRKVYFLSMTRPGYESDKLSLSCYDIEKKSLSSVTGDVDLSIQSIETCDDIHTLFVVSQYKAVSRLFRLHIDDNDSLTSIEVMKGDNSCLSVTHSKSMIYYLESSLTKPSEIMMVDVMNAKFNAFTSFKIDFKEVEGEGETLQSLGMPFVKEVFNPAPQFSNGDKLMPQFTQHYFQGGGMDIVHCWYAPPIDCGIREDKVPLLLIVHGGPQGM